jgi:hypothetical protein
VKAEVPRLQSIVNAHRNQDGNVQLADNKMKRSYCAKLAAVVHSQYTGAPAGDSFKSLAACDFFIAQVPFYLHARAPSEDFGSAAITDVVITPPGGKAESQIVVWALDADNSLRMTLIGASPPQVGTRSGSEKQFDEAAAAFMAALRGNDCPALRSAFDHEKNVLVIKQPCVLLTTPLAAGIRSNPSIKPVALGKTRNFAFYALRYGTDGAVTLAVTTEPRDPRTGLTAFVYDVTPATTQSQGDLQRVQHPLPSARPRK